MTSGPAYCQCFTRTELNRSLRHCFGNASGEYVEKAVVSELLEAALEARKNIPNERTIASET